MRIRRSRFGISLLVGAIIYVALIPVVFDLTLDRAAVLSDADYAKAYHYYTTHYPIAVCDGPGLSVSLATLDHRTALLETTMRTAMDTRHVGLVPRWYSPHVDYYLAIQRRSFIHSVYPFF